MAAPVARVRRMKRPATVERQMTLGSRAASLAETSPFNKKSGSIVIDGAELAATNVLPEDRATTDEAECTHFGPFVVFEKLGEGGMATVHRAEYVVASTGLRKEVALKRLHTDSSEDPALVDAFVHEAQLAAKLQHPNIAQAYELGKIEDTYFIAMELVPGPTLLQVMNQTRNGAGATPLPIALELLVQIADALDHVHDLRDEGGRPLQLVHRDVSPANIVVSRTGQAKLIDFGIAKARNRRHQTQTGYIKGKHGYVAPEYTYGQLDQRADLFAFGVVAHELLTGNRLFSADTELETLRNVRYMAIQPPSRSRAGISPELDKIVLTALDRDPEKRYQNAGAIREALAEEARRQGVVISGPQIRDWVEWAFHQTARKDSSVDRMLRGMSPSVSIEIAEVEVASSAEIAEMEFDANVTNPLPKAEPSQVIELADRKVAASAAAASPRAAGTGSWRPGKSLAARSLLSESAIAEEAERAKSSPRPGTRPGVSPPRPSDLRRAISAEEEEAPTIDRKKGESTSPFAYPVSSSPYGPSSVPFAPPLQSVSPRRVARAASEVAFLPATTMDSLLATRPETPAAAMHARANTPPFVAKPGVQVASVPVVPHPSVLAAGHVSARVPRPATPVPAPKTRAPSPVVAAYAASPIAGARAPSPSIANFVLPTDAAIAERPVSIVAVPSIARGARPQTPSPARVRSHTPLPLPASSVPQSSAANIAAPAIAEPIVEKPAKAKRNGARKSPRNHAVAAPGRAPQWRAPTRWARATPRRSGARVMILFALIAIAALLVDQGLIDIDRWREILSV